LYRSFQEDIRNLQRFSSNVRYPSNERDQSPAILAPQNDQNSVVKLPDIGRCQVELENEPFKESEQYTDDFEDITEERQNLNTSQTGKGSSQEEISSSSNLEKHKQTAGSHSDEKLNSQEDTLLNEQSQEEFTNLKKVKTPFLSPSKTQSGISQQADLRLPPIKVCSPIVLPTKARFIQTAKGIRASGIGLHPLPDHFNSTFLSNPEEDTTFRECSEIHKRARTAIMQPDRGHSEHAQVTHKLLRTQNAELNHSEKLTWDG